MVTIIFYRILGLALLVAMVVPAVGQRQGIRVTLLGTGCPPPVMNRFGPRTLVEAADQKLLFDAGRALIRRQGNTP